MNAKEKIYHLLPSFLQDIALANEARSIRKRRYSPEFFRMLDEVSGRDKISEEELNGYHRRRLKDQLMLAGANSTYYKNLFREYGFNPEKFKDPSELSVFPIQTKDIIKEHYDSMVMLKENERVIHSHTSGTTGSGLIFPESVASEIEKWATWWRYRKNLGIDTDRWCLIFGGRTIVGKERTRPPFWKTLPALRQVSFSMYHLNPATARYYVDQLNREEADWIHGYPSTLAFLASLVREQNLPLKKRFRHITTGAENLLEHQKNLIATVFGTMPYQHYGLAEPVANISECEYHRLHVDEDYAWTEFIPMDKESDSYRLVGTSFTNRALFFLRYDTNDLVLPDNSAGCPCGRNGRIVRSIDGRNEDYLTLKDGTRIGRLDHILKDIVNIREAQIWQDKQGEVEFRIVKSPAWNTSDEILLKKEISSRLRLDRFIIVYPDRIEKSRTGKLKFVVSEYHPR
jgi:phenylacetate-CoA ligase